MSIYQNTLFPVKKTLSSVIRAKLLPVMFSCSALGLILVISTVSALTFFGARIVDFSTPWIQTLSTFLMGGVFSVAGWFMLPVLIVLIAGMFQDITVRRVEKTCYPHSMTNRPPGFWPDLVHDIRFTLRALTLNILVLPLYVLAVGPFVSIALNSYLLGREFFESAASYHMNKAEARTLGHSHKAAIYLGGFMITLLTLTPFLNVFAPIFALVYMIHVLHGIMERKKGSS